MCEAAKILRAEVEKTRCVISKRITKKRAAASLIIYSHKPTIQSQATPHCIPRRQERRLVVCIVAPLDVAFVGLRDAGESNCA